MKTSRFFVLMVFLAVYFLHCGYSRGADSLRRSYANTTRNPGITFSTSLWFTPNEGSPDLLDLFRHPEQWAVARQRINVFQFYATQVLPNRCKNCGNNILNNLLEVRAFEKLRRWGIDTAIGVGVIKEWACSGSAPTRLASAAVYQVESNGGRVKYMAMDEPYLGGDGCKLDLFAAADQTAQFMANIHEINPDIAIGDIEPYPFFTVNRLESWILSLQDALSRRGQTLSFFQIDVDRNHAKKEKVAMMKDLAALADSCHQLGIPFGVIFAGNDGGDDRAYFQDTIRWINNVRDGFGIPDQCVFQSWVESADGSKIVPANLPETAANTHTRLVNEGWLLLFAPPK